jgi:fructokinase
MNIISFGEILFDVIGEVEHLGGAPFNLAAHLSKLGVSSSIISAVGIDERGERIKQAVKELGVDIKYLQENNFPTGYVEVELDNEGKPTYTIHENVAYDNINPIEVEEKFDCFCFGTLSQRNLVSKNSLFNILEKINPEHIFYDVNLRKKYYSQDIIEKSLEHSTIVKLNDEEEEELSELLFNEKLLEAEFAKRLLEKFDLKIVIITRGGEGCAVYTDKEVVEVPGVNVKIADTVGAGDAFSAGFLHKYLETGDIENSAIFANKLGAYVASRAGAIPK